MYLTKPNQNSTAKPNQTKQLWPPNQIKIDNPFQTKPNRFQPNPIKRNLPKQTLPIETEKKTNQTKTIQTKQKSTKPNQTKTNQTKLDLTKYLKGFEMSKSAAQLLYAPVLVFCQRDWFWFWRVRLSGGVTARLSHSNASRRAKPRMCNNYHFKGLTFLPS